MKRFFIKIINFYQRKISPILHNLGVNCKYYPSCSEYMKQAIEKYGCIKGIFLGVIRLFKCNPFSKGGVDLLK